MIRPRLIPCLLLKHGLIVRSQAFKVHQVIGNPVSTVLRFANWNVDELVLLDISEDDRHDMRRDDLQIQYEGTTALDVLRAVANVCAMPLAFGGRIRTLEDMRVRLAAGADKCVVNSRAIEDPEFVSQAAKRFGSQCVVVSVDARRLSNGEYEVFGSGGKASTGLRPADWVNEMQERGAGEIFLTSIDRDGSGQGYDSDLVKQVAAVSKVPLIICGGVGDYGHFAEGIQSGADAVAAANIFHFFELSYPLAKKKCIDAGIPMRDVGLDSQWFPREPVYDRRKEDVLHAQRAAGRPSAARAAVKWCTKCVYPSISAAPMEFNDAGVCTGCQMAGVKKLISKQEWGRRAALLRAILEENRSKDGSRYDCVIPVSGGKDSYFQTHVICKEFGMRPLLVTYNGNNYTPAGWRNVHRMKEVFGVDHVFYSPSVSLLTRLNRLGMTIMGDMNWHSHVGITTLPVRIAAQNKIPLLIWGEHGYLDLCGQFSMDDFPEMSYRDRLEHFARGFEWNYMVGREEITSQEMLPYKYPSDQELFDLNVRGLYLGNYVYWEANEHTALVMEKYGWEGSDEPFDRTYRRMSNLDDMHENGVHDYMKYIKFGYGRCTDHVCKDIRDGRMTREEGIALVRKYDHVKPRDLARWLEYTGMTEAEFDRIADSFRDPRVWRLENGQWLKDNL